MSGIITARGAAFTICGEGQRGMNWGKVTERTGKATRFRLASKGSVNTGIAESLESNIAMSDMDEKGTANKV